jgi:hypothetical protein
MLEKIPFMDKMDAQDWINRFAPQNVCPLAGFANCMPLCPAYKAPYVSTVQAGASYEVTPGHCTAPILTGRNMLISQS